MKRSEFHQLIQTLPDRLFSFAFSILPDDLQAEQLVVDSVNAYLLKEKKNILKRPVNLSDKRELQIHRRMVFKGVLRYMADIGQKRALQMAGQLKHSMPKDFVPFFSLETKSRLVVRLRFDANFNAEEIGEIMQMPRYEVIEKIHNGRFLLMNSMNQGILT
jgi:hypothetical protein